MLHGYVIQLVMEKNIKWTVRVYIPSLELYLNKR